MSEHPVRIDWDDMDQVARETERALTLFQNMKVCASSEGRLCPSCGSSRAEAIGAPKATSRLMVTRRCRDCGCGFTVYSLNADKKDHWAPAWRYDIVSYSIEGYPFFIYFKAGGAMIEGVGPATFPWEV